MSLKEGGVVRQWRNMSTPKAKLHQLYFNTDKKCHYETQQLGGSGIGLLVGPDGLLEVGQSKVEQLFVCTLHLPDGSTVQSANFRRKKDAEQDAASLALQKMNVLYEPGPLSSTPRERWEGLLHKVGAAFTDQMILSYKPMVEHFRAAVQRKGVRFGQVPALVLTVLDNKITSQCKSINRLADNDPAYAGALVCRAAASCPTLRLSDDGLWIGRTAPMSAELVTELLSDKKGLDTLETSQFESDLEVPTQILQLTKLDPKEAWHFEAIRIPACEDKTSTTVQLSVAPNAYFLDVLAHELGVPDAGHVFLTRSITKAPHGTRMFWPLEKKLPIIDVPGIEQLEPFLTSGHLDAHHKDVTMEALRYPGGPTTRNGRASFLMGHDVHGDAILGCVGSTWQSEGKCTYSNVPLSCFHRLMLGRTPRGAYKLSRQALLVADLPSSYTCRAQWQGTNPKSLLVDFCQQHHLPEAQFICTFPPEPLDCRAAEGCSCVGESEGSVDHQVTCVSEKSNGKDHQNVGQKQGPFQYKVVVGSDGEQGKMQFESEGFFRTRSDAMQSAALKAVLHYSACCEASHVLNYFEKQEFCKSNHPPFMNSEYIDNNSHKGAPTNDLASCNPGRNGASGGLYPAFEVIAEDESLGEHPPSGSMVSVSYSVNLVKDAATHLTTASFEKTEENVLEAQSDFKFEMSTGAVVAPFEACISHARVGQTLEFYIRTDSICNLLAACDGLGQPQKGWSLKYRVKLLKHVEAPEERMESSHFSPPLSKQRMEYARTVINALEAKSLVDLGCGSGSLLEVLLEEPNTLEYIAGVDTSQKALIRAAKTLHGTLKKEKPGHESPWASLDRLSLYEGTISDMDPRILSPDLATCIEVVEHMDAEPLEALGESVLGRLVPRVWIVSTPNVEYNPIIQGLEWDPASSSLSDSSTDTLHEAAERTKTMPDPSNFRNHDHRFEWTRAEFRQWASKLAAQYGYQVRFGGVGGDGEDDDNSPGFATQIAVFAHQSVLFPTSPKDSESSSMLVCDLNRSRRVVTSPMKVNDSSENGTGTVHPYKELWRWTPPRLQRTDGEGCKPQCEEATA